MKCVHSGAGVCASGGRACEVRRYNAAVRLRGRGGAQSGRKGRDAHTHTKCHTPGGSASLVQHFFKVGTNVKGGAIREKRGLSF